MARTLILKTALRININMRCIEISLTHDRNNFDTWD